MKLGALAGEYLDARGGAGIVLTYPEVLDCAVRATRYFAAYADIASTPVDSFVSIGEDTDLLVSEWAHVQALFSAYCERENALRLEASRAAGIEFFGRSVSEVETDIAQLEATMAERTFVADIITIG